MFWDGNQWEPFNAITRIRPCYDLGGGYLSLHAISFGLFRNDTDTITCQPFSFLSFFLSLQIDERQSAVQPDGSVQVVLNLSDSSETRSYGFNYEFHLEYTIKLTGVSLQTAITVTNPRLVEIVEGFQCLLHTYMALPKCSSIEDVAVHGLQGSKYIDINDDMLEKTETCVSRKDRDTGDFISGGVRITEPIDRIYKAGTGDLRTVAGVEVHFYREKNLKKHISRVNIEATCSRAANTTWSGVTPSPDIVLWAPSNLKGENERTICVKPGLVSAPIKSLVNGRMTLTQTITPKVFHERDLVC